MTSLRPCDCGRPENQMTSQLVFIYTTPDIDNWRWICLQPGLKAENTAGCLHLHLHLHVHACTVRSFVSSFCHFAVGLEGPIGVFGVNLLALGPWPTYSPSISSQGGANAPAPAKLTDSNLEQTYWTIATVVPWF